jgi:hypothetical protein
VHRPQYLLVLLGWPLIFWGAWGRFLEWIDLLSYRRKKHIGSNAIYSSDPFRSNSLQFMAPSQVVHVLGHLVRGAPCRPSGWGPAAGCSTEGGDGWGPLGLLQLRPLVLGKVWRNAGGFTGLSHADVQSQREKKEVS